MNLVASAKINAILGKYGSEKETCLQCLEALARGEKVGRKEYVTTERGAVLTHERSGDLKSGVR
jgi:hypothetical protein